MRTALKQWVKGAAPGSASVQGDGQRLTLEACSLGASRATDGNGGSRDAMALAILRTDVSIQLLQQDVDIFTARCASDRLIRTFDAAQLAAVKVDDARIQREIAPCLPAGRT